MIIKVTPVIAITIDPGEVPDWARYATVGWNGIFRWHAHQPECKPGTTRKTSHSFWRSPGQQEISNLYTKPVFVDNQEAMVFTREQLLSEEMI